MAEMNTLPMVTAKNYFDPDIEMAYMGSTHSRPVLEVAAPGYFLDVLGPSHIQDHRLVARLLPVDNRLRCARSAPRNARTLRRQKSRMKIKTEKL